MKIKLISHTPNALRVAFAAIRTCYSSLPFHSIWNSEFDIYESRNEDHVRLVKQIVRHGHTSTLEHINFTFSVEGISRACLAQLTRHRLASYSVRSQRYVKGVEWAEGISEVEQEPIVKEFFRTAENIYKQLVDFGYAAEDARNILPNQAATNLVMTINLRSFINLYKVRNLGTHAQEEIGKLAEEMRRQIVAAEPWIAELWEEV